MEGNGLITAQGGLCLNDSIDGWGLHSLGQEQTNGTQTQQLDEQSNLMQRGPENLWRGVLLKPANTTGLD